MKRQPIFTNFINSPYFTKPDLTVLCDKFNISTTSLNTIIQRAIKDRTIISLKRNHYVSNEFFLANRNNIEYKFYLANVLLKSSYISRETALQYWGLLSEANINYYTSTTTRITRIFKNTLGIFEYRNIKADLFTGYKIVKFIIDGHEYSYLIAEPYKAIYDFIYYRIKTKKMPKEELFSLLDDLRIDYHDLAESELDKLIKLFE